MIMAWAQDIFNMLDDRGCFNGMDAEIREEILDHISRMLIEGMWGFE